jgi:chromosome segregation protein
MYLKSLEINGFKSFAQKTTLNFKSKISSIVGPNGSGKSNVAESFRFVLGEQSMKNMRGKKGEDLIFSGKNSRLNRGAVKVIFDNRDRSLKIDYDEVVIERIVYRDGNNEYLINGSRVRAKDVLELLTGANIGSSGHHIISQGEADKILSISPKERKSVIEEALGLKAYVIKKQESERKLLKTEENLKEVKTRERVNAPRIKFLEREVAKIKKSKELREELERLYGLFFPNKKKLEENIENRENKIAELKKKEGGLVEQISKKREELYQSKNKNNDDQNRDEQIQKIILEQKKLEEERAELQKEIARNDLLIENELAKKESYQNHKAEAEKNLLFYKEKLEGVSEIIHRNWMS